MNRPERLNKPIKAKTKMFLRNAFYLKNPLHVKNPLPCLLSEFLYVGIQNYQRQIKAERQQRQAPSTERYIAAVWKIQIVTKTGGLISDTLQNITAKNQGERLSPLTY